jgi:hypothetical protein
MSGDERVSDSSSVLCVNAVVSEKAPRSVMVQSTMCSSFSEPFINKALLKCATPVSRISHFCSLSPVRVRLDLRALAKPHAPHFR